MQPSEPGQPETSLELTFPPGAAHPVDPGTDLDLPASPSLPAPEVPDGPGTPAPTGPLGNLVVAHFRRVEIAMLGRVLVSTLSGALPAAMIRVERRRSIGRRLIGRTGEPIGVTVTAGDRVLSLRAPEVGVVEASVGHVVRGVVLSTTPVPVARWLEELGELLDGLARDDEATRTALEQALLS
jgi:hypothetical protein